MKLCFDTTYVAWQKDEVDDRLADWHVTGKRLKLFGDMSRIVSGEVLHERLIDEDSDIYMVSVFQPKSLDPYHPLRGRSMNRWN